MDYLELGYTSEALIGSIMRFREILEQILQQDAPAALARGFSPLQLDIGPVTQALYVMDTHLAAKPAMPIAYWRPEQIDAYAEYIGYLIDQVFSDDRFIGEMHLDWSRQWLLHGASAWEKTIKVARNLDNQVPRAERHEMLRSALRVLSGTLHPKD